MILSERTKKEILWWVIGTLASLAFVLPMIFATDWPLSDIFLVPAIVFLGYVTLRWIARFGVFDVFAYQFINWTSSWRKNSPKVYKDAYEYKMHEETKREEGGWIWIPPLALGCIYLILCIIFAFIVVPR